MCLPLKNFIISFRFQKNRKGCLRVLELLIAGKPVDKIHSILKNEGFSDMDAAKLVTFIPSAFARVAYEDNNYTFPEFFFIGLESYRKGQRCYYKNEPVFLDAMQLAQQMRRDGDWSNVEQIVSISAEHKGINDAKAQGLTPTGSSVIIYNF